MLFCGASRIFWLSGKESAGNTRDLGSINIKVDVNW